MMTFEKALKSIINWKIYNLILDIVLKYEDEGYACHLAIGCNTTKNLNANMMFFYNYKTGEHSNWNEYSNSFSGANVLIENVKNGCVIYRVVLPKLNKASKEMIQDLKNSPKLEFIGGNGGTYNYFVERK